MRNANPALDSYTLRASADFSAAEVALRGIPNDDPNGAFLPFVLEQIKNQNYFLAEIRHGERIDGFTVYAFDHFGDHKELISIATSAKTATSISDVLEELLIKLAVINNCKSIRLHTVRQGLIRKSLSLGWHVAEVVLRKSIKQ